MQLTERAAKELILMRKLLQRPGNCLQLAKGQHRAYHEQASLQVPDFAASDKLETRADEKVAGGLSAFYALECGLDFFCTESRMDFSVALSQIVNSTLDSQQVQLLNLLLLTTKSVATSFTGEAELSIIRVANNERKNNIALAEPIHAAAKKLLEVCSASTQPKIASLMRSQAFSIEIANYILQSGGYTSTQMDVMRCGPVDEMMRYQISINIAAYFALIACVEYTNLTSGQLPFDIVKNIVDDAVNTKDRDMFCRFANAAWKAGQPFRGLERVEREIFRPYSMLTSADRQKDWVQIRTAARQLRDGLAEQP